MGSVIGLNDDAPRALLLEAERELAFSRLAVENEVLLLKHLLLLGLGKAAEGNGLGMCKSLVFVLNPGYLTCPFLRSRHGKMLWEPWQNYVKHAMGAMAKRRPWQKHI